MIIGLVTVYHPDKKNAANIRTVLEQVDQLYICDNSPVNNEALFQGMNCKYLYNGGNLGIPSAFNKVLQKEDHNIKDEDFLIFFDQDSYIVENHVKKLVEEYKDLLAANINVGCLGPVYFNSNSGKIEVPKMKTPLSEDSYAVGSIITSSMLCQYKNIKEISFWNENLFLDLADWDLCWRLQEAGFVCCQTEKAVLNHTLGESEKRFGPFRIKEAVPVREYYQTRDCRYMMKEKYTPVKYKVRMWMTVYIRPILHLLFLENRRERYEYIKKGSRDYKNNIHGELRE